jgi:hypothetical protein
MGNLCANCETEYETLNNTVVVFTDLLGIVNHGYSLTWCKSIFAYLGPTAYETMKLRSYCKLFSKALKPLPCWTSFPHPKYSSLKGLFNRFTELSRSGSTTAPKMLLIDNGIHVIEDEDHGRRVVSIHAIESYPAAYGVRNYLNIHTSISIVGESREHCIVIGGLWMNGKEKDDVNVSDLTLRKSKGQGIWGYVASMHLDNVSVENSERNGVWAKFSKRNTMKNCNVSHSKLSGLCVYNGLMTISGNATTIHHNGTYRGCYGLQTTFSPSFIHLVSPLTKEMISTNNHGGTNHISTHIPKNMSEQRNYHGSIRTVSHTRQKK